MSLSPEAQTHRLCCEQLFDGLHWYRPGYLELRGGRVVSVGEDPLPEPTERLRGLTLPGMPNLHSHAFQRALSGLTEQRPAAAAPGEQIADSFWSWRERMYQFVARLGPEEVEAVAAQAFLEMLEAGYTSVAEFHYLHHDPTGAPYADLAELGRRVVSAARAVGMRMTLLPVYYEASGFGPQPVTSGQRRFFNDRARFLDLVERLVPEADDLISLGVAPHSLRAVPLDGLDDVVRATRVRDPASVVHLHIAEQRREVEACRAHHGARPVELLLREQPVDDRWCLVHATHLSDQELRGLMASGAVAGLCPTTEANLGDGLFRLREYARGGGHWGIGSDSHVSIQVTEELRWLEYGQRLAHGIRNTLLGGEDRHMGTYLWRQALAGGARALGHRVAGLAVGGQADLVVLDPDHSCQLERAGDDALDSWVFASNRPAIAQVMVNGVWVVRNGVHPARDAVQRRFGDALRRLLA